MISPPKRALRFLRWFCREDYLEEIEGDLIELFEMRCEKSTKKAKRQFVWDVVKSFRIKNLKILNIKSTTMNQIKNYIKIYFRRLKIEPTHYAVNIMSLALGLTVLMFILIYVNHEKRIDGFHKDGDRIYRVTEIRHGEEETETYGVTTNPLAEALKAEFPEIEEAARCLYLGSMNVRYKDRLFQDRNYVFTTASLFNILDLNVLKGDPFKPFNGTAGAVLSSSMAKKLFQDEDPIGKVIEMPNKFDEVLEVLAVMDDPSSHSTYQFQMIFVSNFDKMKKTFPWLEEWDSRGMTTFVKFGEGARPEQVLAKKGEFLKKYLPENIRPYHDFYFQPVSDIHLGSSNFTRFFTEPIYAISFSSDQYLYAVIFIGFFVIAIAVLNYINLSSVQALKRMHEAGVRKVNGATSGQLRVQLLVEAFMSVIISYALTIVLMFFLFEHFLRLVEKPIDFSVIFDFEQIWIQVAILLGVWLVSSVIPASYYSKLTSSLGAMKKNVFSGKGDGLRKTFVTLQYSVSLLLIIGSLILYAQMKYIDEQDLGFDNGNVLTWDINSAEGRDNYEQIINALQSYPEITSATVSSRVPGEWKSQIMLDAGLVKDQKVADAVHYAIDKNWLDAYDVQLLEGENFKGINSADTLKVILNETAVKKLGFTNPIGESVYFTRHDQTRKMQVIGVVKDFHYQSMYQPIEMVVLTSLNNPWIGSDYYSIKHNGDVSRAISIIEETQRKFDPNTAAEINFLDEKWERYYKADEARSTLILIATAISILISAFGLFGLVNFSVERKTKEIGIRKALGATVLQIIRNLLRDYVLLLFVALVIASPVAYYLLSTWLEGFAYRISLSPWVFLAAFIMVSLVSFLTVIFRVSRFAKANPVKSLRYE